MKEWPDKDLFNALREDNKEALSVLFLRHYDSLLHYGMRVKANRILIEECIQELFVYLFESASRLGQVQQVRAYLFKALRRRILEKIKREKRLESRDALAWFRSDISFSDDDIQWNQREDPNLNAMLLKALNSLPWRQREAVYLRYYNRLSTKEIAEIMGAANQTVLNTLHQALKNLRKNSMFDHLI